MKNDLNSREHQNPTLAVDIGLVCLDGGNLRILLIARKDRASVGGAWALPGGIVHIDETIDQTATRVLETKAKLDQFYLEQLETFGALDRDPRGRVVSVAYFALTSHTQLLKTVSKQDDLILATISMPSKEKANKLVVLGENGQALDLAFDHEEIINRIIVRLKGKIEYTPIALSFLPKYFTLREVQQVYETILSTSFAKPAFRRKLLDRAIIQPTGKLEEASAFRPAELYKRL